MLHSKISHGTRKFARGYADLIKRPQTGQVFVQQGPGGRSSVSGHVVTVLGATGFLGRYLVNRIGQAGSQVVVPFRGARDDMRHLKPMGDLGQIVPLEFNLNDEKSLVEAMRNSDVVYNLMGRDYQTKNFSFEKVHVEGAQKVAKLARELGVTKLIHVSAMNASSDSSSHFLRTKAAGEQAVRSEFPEATIVRPGVMYGSEDKFFNRWCSFMVFTYSIPTVNGGETKFMPVFVGDVANAMSTLVKSDVAVGKDVELYGPQSLTYKQIFDAITEITYRNPVRYNIPVPIAKAVAGIYDKVTFWPLITADEVERLTIDDEPTPGAMTFSDLGVEPTRLADNFIKFTRMYRSSLYYDEPWEPALKILEQRQ